MAKNIRYTTDNQMIIESVGADYSAGDFIVQGILHGVSLSDVASGADAVVQAVGEIEYAKTAGETWTEGEDLYYDAVSDAFTVAITADGIVRGVAAEDALIDVTSGLVRLVPGRMAADADYVAYDNATSGLVATTVQDAVDELASDKMDLVATPTDGNLLVSDAAGQGVDSGVAAAALQLLVATPTDGNLIVSNASGQGVDSGVAAADVQVLTVPTIPDCLAGLDAAGALYDSTVPVADMADAAVAGAVYGDQMRNSSVTAQSTADSTATLIDLEVVELVGGVIYDAGVTSLATIPAGSDGLYAIVYGATFATGGGAYNRLEIKINGVTRTDDEGTPDNANPVEVVGNTIVRLAAGDTVGLYAQQDSGGALDVTSAYLAIQRMQ